MCVSTTTKNTYSEGIVIRKSTGHCWVQNGKDVLVCSLSSMLRKQFVYPTSGYRHTVQRVIENDHTDPLAVGDLVRYICAEGNTGMVVEVLPRRSRLSRRSVAYNPGGHHFEQVIAANVDLVIPIIAAARPAPSWNLLDRNLASAKSLDLPSLICITKLDLVLNPDGSIPDDLQDAASMYRRIGYEMIFTSTVSGEGIDLLQQALKDHTAVFIGKSGVGKTSLLNALQPGLGLRIADVGRKAGKGRHTTSFTEMYPLDFGAQSACAQVIDTPGMREFGLWDVDEDDLAYFFREMRPYVGQCKFGLNCLHDEEPGCAVRRAVLSGEIDPRRYRSFLIMQKDGYYT